MLDISRPLSGVSDGTNERVSEGRKGGVGPD